MIEDLLTSAAAVLVFLVGRGFLFLVIGAFILGFFLTSAVAIGLQASAEFVGSSMAGTAASVLWLFSQLGSVIFIVLMESAKTSVGSFHYSIVVLVILDVLSGLLCLRIVETGNRISSHS